jgi:heat shock protein HtpX
VPGLGRGDSLFSTHPATENRIAALEALADQAGLHAPPPLADGARRASALDPLGRNG